MVWLDPDSSPRHIEETRAYLRDFNQVVAKTSTGQKKINLYEKMLALHPNRVNPGSLWATAKVLKGNAGRHPHRSAGVEAGSNGRSVADRRGA